VGDDRGSNPILSSNTTSEIQRLALTKAEAAAALGVSDDFMDDHIWHELKLVRRGRKVLVSIRELEAWLERSSERTL
jgi:excisionase family DNA binding protein